MTFQGELTKCEEYRRLEIRTVFIRIIWSFSPERRCRAREALINSPPPLCDARFESNNKNLPPALKNHGNRLLGIWASGLTTLQLFLRPSYSPSPQLFRTVRCFTMYITIGVIFVFRNVLMYGIFLWGQARLSGHSVSWYRTESRVHLGLDMETAKIGVYFYVFFACSSRKFTSVDYRIEKVKIFW